MDRTGPSDRATAGSPRGGITRRALLKAAAAAPLAAWAAPPADAASARGDTSWDGAYDVVIVGSGFAGTSAAIEARRLGASTLVVEKMAVFGGNSAINGGAFAVAGSPLQAREGVRDSVDRMVEDMLAAGRGLNHLPLLRVIAEGTRWAYEFTLEHGVAYKDALLQFGGHSVPRTLQTTNNSGGGIVVPLGRAARRMGAVFQNRTLLTDILRGPSGEVAGIAVRDGYRFPDGGTGSPRRIRVRRGLVMATGGFSADLRFRMQQDPGLDASLESTNHPGATAEGLAALLRSGATPVQLDQIQLGPWASPDEKGFGLSPQFLQQAAFPYGILVDVRTGRRFVNEMADRKTRADAIMQLRDAGGGPVYPVAFVAEEGTGDSPSLGDALRYGVARKFGTVEALAESYGIDRQGLADQVRRYNECVRSGRDTEFGKTFFRKITLERGPFYAGRAWVKVHHCMGGVGINPRAEVLDMAAGEPIAGLFAAGEVTGGIHGASRLGSCAIAECLVMGRIAGENAARRGA